MAAAKARGSQATNEMSIMAMICSFGKRRKKEEKNSPAFIQCGVVGTVDLSEREQGSGTYFKKMDINREQGQPLKTD